MSRPPRRILLVSATIGEGHNATARAIEEAALRLWPDCEVSWVDALKVMGRWVPPVFQWIYVVNVESTPWLYNFFYAALWRYRWFANSSRRFVGVWSGLRLRPVIRAREPDLIVSTYPLGTAGLDWLRRQGELNLPVAAVISDFSPHPFWVYPEIDQHYVMSEASLRALHQAVPEAVGAVSVPPVVSAFRPEDKAEARRSYGLPEDEFVVLISCGSLGFGSIDRAVEAALAVPEVSRVVVICGRNETSRRRFADRAEREPRLDPLGWVDDMPRRIARADVIITNAGGATALEALAAGRTVVMFEPIAGHGKANAELMAEAGLAELCPAAEDLTRTLSRLARDPSALTEIERRAVLHARSADFTDQVAALYHVAHHEGRRRLRAQDAFFTYAVTPVVLQQTCAVLRIDASEPGMTIDDWEKHLAERISRRAAHLPMLHSRLITRRGRRPVWASVEQVDPVDHLSCREVGDGRQQQVLDEFFSTPLRTDQPPWEMLLLRTPDSDQLTVLVKMHHSLGDGLAITNTLLRLIRDGDDPHPAFRTERGRPRSLPRLRETARGLVSLASAGAAPPSGIRGRSTAQRWFGWIELVSRPVRESARAWRVSSTVMLLTVIAEALHRLLHDRSGTTPGQRFRVMVPQRERNSDNGALRGNHTAAVSIDLPVGPMSPEQRVRDIAERVTAARGNGQIVAAGAVMSALGYLPAPLHAWVTRRIYQRRFFSGIVSVMPGMRQYPRTAGMPITGVFPLLPLADGVGLAIGALNWGPNVSFGVTADSGLVTRPDELLQHLKDAMHDLCAPEADPLP